MVDEDSLRYGDQPWIECPCCGDEVFPAELLCTHCGERDCNCMPRLREWLFIEQSGDCPSCGCAVGVSADGERAWGVLICDDDEERMRACQCPSCLARERARKECRR